MLNHEIFDKFEESVGPFNMPDVCKIIAHYHNIIAEGTEETNTRAENKYEAVWWTTAIEKANDNLNKQQ